MVNYAMCIVLNEFCHKRVLVIFKCKEYEITLNLEAKSEGEGILGSRRRREEK